jgi:hypothetical protein
MLLSESHELQNCVYELPILATSVDILDPFERILSKRPFASTRTMLEIVNAVAPADITPEIRTDLIDHLPDRVLDKFRNISKLVVARTSAW